MLAFFEVGQQLLCNVGLTDLSECTGSQGLGQVILQLQLLETVHGTHLSLVGQSQNKETVGLDGLIPTGIHVFLPLLGAVGLVFQQTIQEVLRHIVALLVRLN